MFSIAAINDTDSAGQWEPLAPTKEAQEFHLSQAYHEGLLRLQAKEYSKAQELFESVLRDPLIISSAQVGSNTRECHLLQLRFLALKNLATVFLQQGSLHYEGAIRCYLEAVEIDAKDSVVWNKLGTLSCSMGLLSISRWAFEQGLLCSPNNWNCMEKLLEVLIAIRDEVSCHSVAESILCHWPSHSRALEVKKVLEEAEPIPFAPRGIDKLEPKHVRLKFLKRRRVSDDSNGNALKKHKTYLEVYLSEASWIGVMEAIIKILGPVVEGNSDASGACSKDDHSSERSTSHSAIFFIRNTDTSDIKKEEECSTMDLAKHSGVKLKIVLPSSSGTVPDVESGSANTERRVSTSDILSLSDCGSDRSNGVKDKEVSVDEDHPHERRSTRLERLRNRKPEKEECMGSRDQAELLVQLLEPFIIDGRGMEKVSAERYLLTDSDFPLSIMDDSYVNSFVKEVSNNYGACHVGHLLLERISSKGLPYQESFLRLLELEKLTRSWTQDRTPYCSLFLAELYYDIGSYSASESQRLEYLSEASYHLCKVIEVITLDYAEPLNPCLSNQDLVSAYELDHPNQHEQDETKLEEDSLKDQSSLQAADSTSDQLVTNHSVLPAKCSFRIRFHWLSGRLSTYDNKAKAHEEFNKALSFFINGMDMVNLSGIVPLPHCRIIKHLSLKRILYEISLLKIEHILSRSGEMVENGMHDDCVRALSPLVLCNKDTYLDVLFGSYNEQKGLSSVELSALDFLISSYDKDKRLKTEDYLNCHWRKLQILTTIAEVAELFLPNASHPKKSIMNLYSASLELEAAEKKCKYLKSLVAEEVREISLCASQLGDSIDENGKLDGFAIPMATVAQIQNVLLIVMSNMARGLFRHKPVCMGHLESNCFVDAAMAFCKLQHAITSIPVKTQVDLIVTMHELLAEYGLCCAGKDSEGEEGLFLKLAIRHLLALDVKLKSAHNLPNSTLETKENVESLSNNSACEVGLEANACMEAELTVLEKDESSSVDKDAFEEVIPEKALRHGTPDKDEEGVESGKDGFDRKSDSQYMKVRKNGTSDGEKHSFEVENQKVELGIDNALDQSFFCLYGLNLKSGTESAGDDDLAVHRNTNRGDYQTKEQCADVFRYLLPYAKASSRAGLVKLRRVLRAIRKHFPQPPEEITRECSVDKFLDSSDVCEEKFSEMAGSGEMVERVINLISPGGKGPEASIAVRSEPYLEVYSNLYFFLAQAEDMNATDRWPGFVLTKEGEEFIEQNANLFKFDLLYNPLRFESWQRLANIYDEEVDLMLNDGSKHINVREWRKQPVLSQRVEISRRRSRRSLLMSLALARTPTQQGQIHELLALVYYDSLQNVVPFYDQRLVSPTKDATWSMFCKNSMKHFEKAFAIKPDWSHALYLGKLCEKLKYPCEKAFSYYSKASSINPLAVDAVYRTHASRLKLLSVCGKHDLHALQVIAEHALHKSAKDSFFSLIGKVDPGHQPSMDEKENTAQTNPGKGETQIELQKLEEAWETLYDDCLSALEVCVEGELKHFHKARYMLAQGLYRRGNNGDLQRAKEELSFCFKSSRSAFTIYMWEIDGAVKKGRRRTPGPVGNKKGLELGMPESSRKFITCIRKYTLLYLHLLEKSGDFSTLERAYSSLRTDRRFSLCLEDIVPVALGRYVQALCSSIRHAETAGSSSTVESLLERLFHVFIENGSMWNEISGLPELNISSGSVYGYIHQYIHTLESDMKLDTLEVINERIRKRFKNPKLANTDCAKVCKHASAAWCRTILSNLASITPSVGESQMEQTQVASCSDNNVQLCIDIQEGELWHSTVEDPVHQKELELKRSRVLSKIKNMPIKQAMAENMQIASTLLRCAYNFYRDSHCGTHISGINLYTTCRSGQASSLPGAEHIPSPSIDVLDLSIPRKLLLWAYALIHGRYSSILSVVKHCEENMKMRLKKGPAASAAASHPCPLATQSVTGGEKNHHENGGETDDNSSSVMAPATAHETDSRHCSNILPISISKESQKVSLSSAAPLHQCNNSHADHHIQGGQD
ncbi:unnamed protein product [Victoria cruziana]